MRGVLVALLVAVMTAGAWLGSPIPVQAERGLIAGGIGFGHRESYGFVYGELYITESMSVGLEHFPRASTLSAWFGRDFGLYGEVTWFAEGGSSQAWEAGVWGTVDLGERLEVSGWVGALRPRDGSRTRLSVNAEAAYTIRGPLFLVVGAGTYNLDPDRIAGWAGVGYAF